MLISTASFAAIVVAVVGALIMWSNPGRAVNRVVFTCSLHLAIWLGFLHLAAYVFHGDAGLFWLRLACAVGAAVPFHFWLVQECVVTGDDRIDLKRFRRSLGWIAISISLGALCFTDFFIPSSSTSVHRVRGLGYYVYIFADLALYAFLFRNMFKTTQRLTGDRRLELQVWLGGGCATTSAIFITMALNAITRDPLYIRLQPLFILGFYAATAYAITSHRIFDASQILRLSVSRIVLALVVSAVSYGTYRLVVQLLPSAIAFLPTTIVTLIAAAVVRSWIDSRFQYYPQATAARQEAFAVASRESQTDKLERGFLKILKGWGQTDHAILLSGNAETLRGSGLELDVGCVAIQGLRQLRWITPERLGREKTTPERAVLAELLVQQKLGVLILKEGPSLMVLVGCGVAASRRPYTYPQVTQLMELGSIFGGALERAHLTEKMQHAEQLATVGLLGASLAHEIRNPLVSIKTFVQLLPTRHQDPIFREKFFRLMTEEVNRIDRLTEQLLELASPRAYSAQMVELHAVLKASLELVAPKAADKRVRLLTEFDAIPDQAFTDPSAVKQVVLNLCLNGIQASESRDAERWVKIGTRNRSGVVEMFVSDSGLGIAPEIRTRLFRPFQSTKSSGFGLGLAICRDILTGLNAGIEVDPPETGHGATFRVTFPCQPS